MTHESYVTELAARQAEDREEMARLQRQRRRAVILHGLAFTILALGFLASGFLFFRATL